MGIVRLSNNREAIYDGGGTSNALGTATTSAQMVALTADVLFASADLNVLDLQVWCDDDGKAATLVVMQFDGPVPAVANMIRSDEYPISHGDLRTTQNATALGLSSATAYVKPGFPVPILPGASVMIALAAADSANWYLRYKAGRADPAVLAMVSKLRGLVPAGAVAGGLTTAIGATQVRLTATPTPCLRGVLIIPPRDSNDALVNSATVIVGATGLAAGDGPVYQIAPDNQEGVFVPVADVSALYAIALGGATAQQLGWIIQ